MRHLLMYDYNPLIGGLTEAFIT